MFCITGLEPVLEEFEGQPIYISGGKLEEISLKGRGLRNYC